MQKFNGIDLQKFEAGTGKGLGPCGGGMRRGSVRGFGRRRFNGMDRNINQQDKQMILEEEFKEIENEKRAISEKIEKLKNN